jgi:exopolyphosphatase/guanosine-5'-triphosphate,3'-diphosphate pyrophosphatase
MNHAIIDIGSNSMRLTLYEINGTSFKVLFKTKYMAGLAGYVREGTLLPEGIERAYSGLLEFKEILESLQIRRFSVFATASLRNIANTDAALAAIHDATGFNVEILSADDEAYFGYVGAMRELNITRGVELDIGGASTEIVTFDDNRMQRGLSFPVGSLSLYRDFVPKIIPGRHSLHLMEQELTRQMEGNQELLVEKRPLLVCVGGTSRAVLKFAKTLCNLSSDSHTISSSQLLEISDYLSSGEREAINLILKIDPERIHTLIPGLMIMKHVCTLFHSTTLLISSYGVREGYLCERVIGKTPS